VPAVPVRQLIINGGFQTPDTPTVMAIYAGQNTIAPWVVGLDSVEVGDAVDNGFLVGPAFEGAQSLDLNGTGRGRLTQAFATTPGSVYTLTFAYANNYYNSSTPASARVRLFDSLGDRLNQTITHATSVAGDLVWTVFTAQFTALQDTTSLEFTSLTDANGSSGGILLDAVQVFEGALEIDSITRPGNVSVLMEGRGFANAVHRIQASVDLSDGSFIDIATVTADAGGLFEFEDAQTGPTNKYYRVVYP
jgi:hypothetical protein